MKKSLLGSKKAVSVIAIAVTGIALAWVFLDQPRPHNPRVYAPPEKTQWKPVGARSAGQHNYDIIPEPITWHAIHVDVANADSVWGVAAPMFELDWVAEPAYFSGSGPLLDNQGNLYFSSNFYHGERVDLVAIDANVHAPGFILLDRNTVRRGLLQLVPAPDGRWGPNDLGEDTAAHATGQVHTETKGSGLNAHGAVCEAKGLRNVASCLLGGGLSVRFTSVLFAVDLVLVVTKSTPTPVRIRDCQ